MLKNSGMQLDDIFEDLEAMFEGQLLATNTGTPMDACNLIRVRNNAGETFELALPILGDDFLAGMRLGANDFHVARYSTITRIQFVHLTDESIPLLRILDCDLDMFIGDLPKPLEFLWRVFGQKDYTAGILAQVVNSIVIIEQAGTASIVGVPLLALTELRVSSVESSSASFTVSQ